MPFHIAVLPYFPYGRQSKKKSHRGAITARMLANLLGVAGVHHVITVDLHASQMQGFFKCPVDNLHAEPLIARWIRHNIPNWRDGVVVSKNAGGTKRVTSLADALKLNFGMVTTDKKRGPNMTASMIMNHLDGFERNPALESTSRQARPTSDEIDCGHRNGGSSARMTRVTTDSQGSPQHVPRPQPHVRTSGLPQSPLARPATTPAHSSPVDDMNEEDEQQYDDGRVKDVTHGRLIQGHIVDDDFPSPDASTADNSFPDDDPMTMSHASSFFAPEPHALGGSGDVAAASEDEDDVLVDPKIEHMITLVGDVKNRPVFIVDDMIDKPGSWIAAAETVVKRGFAKKVYCMATHGVFGEGCLEQMQACECIDAIIVTNSFPISEQRSKDISKLVVLDLSFLLGEAIRRNHYGESISPLFQHIVD
jgi:ribose-phosphate pyrophosphokinase